MLWPAEACQRARRPGSNATVQRPPATAHAGHRKRRTWYATSPGVGMAGFEPTTFRSQSGRATNLRHIPCRRRESTRPPPAPGGPVPPTGRPVRQRSERRRDRAGRRRRPAGTLGTARTRPAWSRSLRGRSSMAEPLPSKQTVRVRFPSPAPPRLTGSPLTEGRPSGTDSRTNPRPTASNRIPGRRSPQLRSLKRPRPPTPRSPTAGHLYEVPVRRARVVRRDLV